MHRCLQVSSHSGAEADQGGGGQEIKMLINAIWQEVVQNRDSCKISWRRSLVIPKARKTVKKIWSRTKCCYSHSPARNKDRGSLGGEKDEGRFRLIMKRQCIGLVSTFINCVKDFWQRNYVNSRNCQ